MHRYMRAQAFAQQLKPLHAFPGENVGDGLLEELEALRLVVPRLRLRFPDSVARKLWLDRYPDRTMRHEVEPDGGRWDAAVELSNALYRWANHRVYGFSAHPFDDLDPRFTDFVQNPKDQTFVPWKDMAVDISLLADTQTPSANSVRHEVPTPLGSFSSLKALMKRLLRRVYSGSADKKSPSTDSSNVEAYYSSWQVLLAAEVADMGIHCRVNLADDDIRARCVAAVRARRIPEGSSVLTLGDPVLCMLSFQEHEQMLNAVVWFAEETHRALNRIARHHSGRSLLTGEEQQHYRDARRRAAADAAERFAVGSAQLTELCRFLARRWSCWDGKGRPCVASAYKDFLADTVNLPIQLRHVREMFFLR
ncbi:MAG: hypothetical protein HC869_22860 [Rhodospirillales bacterium]|nr:hypothetical protein [Rhodospirillales bacterium]